MGAGLGAGVGACGDWRNALGPEPLEVLRDIVLRASWAEHEGRDWRAVAVGRARPLKTGALDPAGTDKAAAERSSSMPRWSSARTCSRKTGCG